MPNITGIYSQFRVNIVDNYISEFAEFTKYSPGPHTVLDSVILHSLGAAFSWFQDIPDARIMDAMTICQGKPADKLAAAEVYMRLKGYK